MNDMEIKEKIKDKGSLLRRAPATIEKEYGKVLQRINLLKGYCGVNMNVQLEGIMDTQDVSSHYEDTEYKGIKGLRIRITANELSKETDMEIMLDGIYQLEKDTDFIVVEISKENNGLIVKGEVYGL